MKSLFSFCLFALSAMALGQQNVLFLELSADGAGDEAVVLVDIATEPALSDAPMTVTLMGDEEVTLTIALPDGTMQGVDRFCHGLRRQLH